MESLFFSHFYDTSEELPLQRLSRLLVQLCSKTSHVLGPSDALKLRELSRKDLGLKASKHAAVEPALILALENLKRGQTQALSQILDLTRPRLYRFCFHLTGNSSTAEELAQEVFLKGLGLIQDLTDAKMIYNWLFKIAKNLYIDGWRSAEGKLIARSNENNEEENDKIAALPSADSKEMDTILAVREALQSLAEPERMALLLIDHEGYAYDEAAKILKISDSTLRSRLNRARSQFLQIFEKGAA